MGLLARLLAVALVMSAILAGLVVRHAWLRANGTEIRLAMEPVDPRDILLGHYAILRTPLHRLDTAALEGPRTGWAEGDIVYVSLSETQDGSAVARGAWRTAPDGLYIQGRVSTVYTQRDYSEPAPREDGTPRLVGEPIPGTERDELQVRYNLERYFAPQEQALALERMRNEDRLRLIVSVGEDGSAVIKGLEIDGEAQYDTLL